MMRILITIHSKKKHYDSSVSATSEESDYVPDVEATIDHRGNIRKYLAVDIALESNDINMVCSPLSALLPIAKMVFGTSKHSETEKALLDAIGLKSRKEIRPNYKKMIKDIEYLHGVQMSVASRMFVSKRNRLQSRFKHKTTSIFGSAVEVVDMEKQSKTANIINKWVQEHTNNSVGKIIDTFDIYRDASIILVNAVYFKGKWRDQFSSAQNFSFHGANGKEYSVSPMSRTGNYPYIKSKQLNAKILELPYEGEQAAMIILLPFENDGLPILLRTLRLSPKLLTDALKQMKISTVDVDIPRFKISSTLDLKHFYSKVGLQTINIKKYGFDKIIKDSTVHLSIATQKAVIEVTEEGTKAASATVIVGLQKSMAETFIADHPFLFYVIANNEQLFSGVVNEVKETKEKKPHGLFKRKHKHG